MRTAPSIPWMARLARRLGRRRDRSDDAGPQLHQQPGVDVEELIARAGGRVSGDLPGQSAVSAGRRSAPRRPAWVQRLATRADDVRDQD